MTQSEHTPSQALLDSIACGVIETDAKGLIRRVNSLFCSWVDRSASELVGHLKIQDLFSVGGKIFHQTHWLPLLQMQQSVAEVKFDVMRRDGTSIPIVLNAIRRMDGDVVVHSLAAFMARDRDTYERELLATGKRLEQLAAEATLHEARARDRVLFAEQMIGIVSHDLRNPLSVVSLSALVLRRGGVTPEQQFVIERIERATTRASRMIGDLLDFTQARMGSGIAIVRKLIPLDDVIAEAVKELRQAFPESELHYDSQDLGTCDADADRLEQAIGNLVTNAIAYGAHGRPIIVSATCTDGLCTIIVHNEGKPIPAEKLGELFQPLTRGHQAPGASRSIGLGLYIVSEIAKAHGGKVSVTSSLEDGTRFTVQFPRSAA